MVSSDGESSACRILPIAVTELVAIWPLVEPHLRRALSYGHNCWEPVDILAELMRGEAELWVAWLPPTTPAAGQMPQDAEVLAAMVTRIIPYPRRKSCQIFLIGGRRMRLWSEPFLTTIEAYARSHKCHLLEGGARLGWSRVGNFRQVGVTLIKEIHYG